MMNDMKAKVMGSAYLKKEKRKEEEFGHQFSKQGKERTHFFKAIFFLLTFPSQAMGFLIYSVIGILQNQLESAQ